MNDSPKDPLASIQLIDAMINKARNRFSENGHLYLLWGWVILVCSLCHFLLKEVVHYPNYFFVWLLTWAAAIYQTVYLILKKRKQTVQTYTDDILKYVWLVFIVISGFIIVLVSKQVSNPDATTNLFLVLYGMPTFLSGIILKQKSLVVGGCFCWLLAIISMFIPMNYHMLLLSAAVILAWIIPGYQLRERFKKNG